MPVFPSISGEPALDKVFRRFPHAVMPLLEYHDRVLRDWSPLTVAERELIAAYVSGLNACTYCHGAHVVAARAFGIDSTLFDGLMADLDSSAVDDRLKPILAYVGKLTRTPAMMSEADADLVYAAGWDEQALFDAVSVCALFNLMNRIVEGSGIKSNPLEADEAEMQARLARMGGMTEDPHRGEPSYSRLAEKWGIAPKA
ncbi:carboxymuconolactone decarboxylase family protein [Novosphingobium sp.]|uniref:carboxymuconolactone decarboxylase family protein n=1 Tax=Novosphingobium sp. TaxID=1874826 RepID=UPI002737638D|nr:peroxidase-related enzyme [Novosphingobium sp.]MDP3906737.1 peroxidase-related enzyme [Novosphingobium sp.]